jgi:cbb3-type cytochrome oxidase subunit 1
MATVFPNITNRLNVTTELLCFLGRYKPIDTNIVCFGFVIEALLSAISEEKHESQAW